MKISTEIASISKKVSYEKAVEYVAKAGFDAYDFSMFDMLYYDQIDKISSPGPAPLGGGDCLDFVRKIRRIADDRLITYTSKQDMQNCISCFLLHYDFHYF